MRILHICGTDVVEQAGGLGVAVDEISRRQAKMGHHVAVLHMNQNKPTFERRNDGRDLIRSDVTSAGVLKGDLQYHRMIYRGMCNTLAECLGRDKFDVIHVHDTVCWPVAELARHLFQCPVILTSHLSFNLENFDSPVWTTAFHTDAQEEAIGMTEASSLTTVSKPYAKLLKDFFFMPRDIKVIPNGIDIAPIDNAPLVDIRKYTGGKKAVYFSGRIVPGKGIQMLLDAIRALPEYHFLVFARTAAHHADVTYLERALANHEFFLDNMTWFRNFPLRSQFGYLKACDMALVPSINPAPFEITGLEAMAARVPLITTAVCGMKDYCHDGNCDMHELTSDGLINAIRNHKRDEAKIEAARKTAESYTWESAAAQYVNHYEEIANAYLAINRAA
jgi:glycosyltransferase involved in cell wall biosynthesis